MDEEISIIDTNTRSEKIKNFIIKNRRNLIGIIIIIIFLLIGYFTFNEIKTKSKIKLADQYNSTVINFKLSEKEKTIIELINIINKKDKTYSPLALYFLIDNSLISNKEDINRLFNVLINKTKLEYEIKNLIIYKKGVYNSDFENENNLIQILAPVINSESIWKSHSLFLMGEYFYSKNQKQKAKEYFENIMLLKNSNQKIRQESQKKLNRDFGG
jgi:predicted negative regulator of RcsB-dependent stress response